MSMLDRMSEGAKHAADVTSAAVTFGALLKFLPALAALLSIVWTSIRIYEWWRGRTTED